MQPSTLEEKQRDTSESPENVDSLGSLRYTTSKQTTRYNESSRVEPGVAVVAAGMFISSRDATPAYLPPQWSAYTHPEGQLYFYRNSVPRIVTEAYIYHPDIMAKVGGWSRTIEELIAQKHIVLSDNIELFLQIDDNDCAYYFVDHATRTEFWLDALNTDDLGISAVASPSHLRMALEELYWVHVEHFPMHFGGLGSDVLDELTSVFSHAFADHMTSRFSTFPYSAPECEKFLQLLRTSRTHLNDGHTTCFVARLWSLISNHRVSTHYGERHARLSRDQAILIDDAQESHLLAVLTSLLSFQASYGYQNRLNDIFIDHLVYAHRWRPFMSACLQDWNAVLRRDISILMLHVLLVFVPSSPLLALISSSCLGASLIFSTLLVYRHEPLEDATATRAFIYLDSIRSDRFKFQLVSFVYSLPKALYFWSLVAFFANWFLVLARHTGIRFTIGFLCLCCLAMLAFQRTTSETALPYRSPWSYLLPRKDSDEESLA